MIKDERLKKIRELQELRDSRVISYLTADRGVANAPVAEDVLRIVYDHLRACGPTKRIDLLIYSRGGDTMLPWPLVTTIRSFCEEFSVLVPFRAHSAATLIALGADEILMSPLGQLTPVEPTVTTSFNPTDKINPRKLLGINVEDVSSYIEFTKERGGVNREKNRTEALKELTKEVSPVALGRLHRAHKLARQQAERMLQLHMPASQKKQINEIVENVITRLWAHEYKIGPREAEELGLKVSEATGETGNRLWELYEGYEATMKLREPILPMASLFPAGQAQTQIKDVKMAYVESEAQTDAFVFDFELNRGAAVTPPGQPQQFGPDVQLTITRQEWARE
jgi:hypothetical protein